MDRLRFHRGDKIPSGNSKFRPVKLGMRISDIHKPQMAGARNVSLLLNSVAEYTVMVPFHFEWVTPQMNTGFSGPAQLPEPELFVALPLPSLAAKRHEARAVKFVSTRNTWPL